MPILRALSCANVLSFFQHIVCNVRDPCRQPGFLEECLAGPHPKQGSGIQIHGWPQHGRDQSRVVHHVWAACRSPRLGWALDCSRPWISRVGGLCGALAAQRCCTPRWVTRSMIGQDISLDKISAERYCHCLHLYTLWVVTCKKGLMR